MIRLLVAEAKLRTLEREWFNDPHSGVQRKIEVADLTAHVAGGRHALRAFHPHPKIAALGADAGTLRSAFQVRVLHSVQVAGDRIEVLTGVWRGPTLGLRMAKKTELGVRRSAQCPVKRPRRVTAIPKAATKCPLIRGADHSFRF